MRLFGYEITRARPAASSLTPPALAHGGWFPIIREPYTGAWQNNESLSAPSALAYFAVYGCVTLITTDIGKLHLRLVTSADDGTWSETTNPAYSPVLRKPNRYQTVHKFVEQWITSKLTAGNAYVLKQRDGRGVVTALYVLDPLKVTPLIAPDGAVYYSLKVEPLSGLVMEGRPEGAELIVPAREIIHDPMVTLFHPLMGVTPLYACGMAAQHGLTMQSKSEQFFRGGSHPGGVLTAPGEIGDDQAQRIKQYWQENFTGANVGNIAVVGRGLKYEPMTISSADAQLIEQFNFTAQQVCTAYHVPPELLDLRPFADLEVLLQKYHSQCIQSLLTNFETSLDEGLELHAPYGTEFDIDDLIWMVTSTKTKAAAEAIGAGALSPDEARRKWFGLGPVPGGDTPYMQQQNYSLKALAQRDADQPFSKAAPPAPAAPVALPDDEADTKAFDAAFEQACGDISWLH